MMIGLIYHSSALHPGIALMACPSLRPASLPMTKKFRLLLFFWAKLIQAVTRCLPEYSTRGKPPDGSISSCRRRK